MSLPHARPRASLRASCVLAAALLARAPVASAVDTQPPSVPGTDGVPLATAPTAPVALAPDEGFVWFEAPAGPYQVVAVAVDAGPVPDVAGRACVAPCGLRLPAGQWRVHTRWEGGLTSSDFLGIAPGVSVRRAYEHPQHNAFVPGAQRLGPTVNLRYGFGVALAVTGGVTTIYGAVALSLGLSATLGCGASTLSASCFSSGTGSVLLYSGLVASIAGPVLILSGVLLARSGGSMGLAARRDVLRFAPALAVSTEGAYAGVRVTF